MEASSPGKATCLCELARNGSEEARETRLSQCRFCRECLKLRAPTDGYLCSNAHQPTLPEATQGTAMKDPHPSRGDYRTQSRLCASKGKSE